MNGVDQQNEDSERQRLRNINQHLQTGIAHGIQGCSSNEEGDDDHDIASERYRPHPSLNSNASKASGSRREGASSAPL